MPTVDPANQPTTTRGKTTERQTVAVLSIPSRSALWRHGRSKPSRRDKAAKQECLTPCEGNALVDYVLHMSKRGYPLPVEYLPSLALVIARQHSSTF
jgi:hypothetical protein